MDPLSGCQRARKLRVNYETTTESKTNKRCHDDKSKKSLSNNKKKIKIEEVIINNDDILSPRQIIENYIKLDPRRLVNIVALKLKIIYLKFFNV